MLVITKKTKRNYFSRAFSLVEMVVYVALMTMLLLLIVDVVLVLGRSYKDIKANNAIMSSAIFSLDRMVREIRNAKSIDNTGSVFGTSPGSLKLNTTDDSGNARTVQFYVQNGILEDKENGVYIGPLTLSGATVSNLVFRQINNLKSQAVKVEITVMSGVAPNLHSTNFFTTVVMRNSY